MIAAAIQFIPIQEDYLVAGAHMIASWDDRKIVLRRFTGEDIATQEFEERIYRVWLPTSQLVLVLFGSGLTVFRPVEDHKGLVAMGSLPLAHDEPFRIEEASVSYAGDTLAYATDRAINVLVFSQGQYWNKMTHTFEGGARRIFSVRCLNKEVSVLTPTELLVIPLE